MTLLYVDGFDLWGTVTPSASSQLLITGYYQAAGTMYTNGSAALATGRFGTGTGQALSVNEGNNNTAGAGFLRPLTGNVTTIVAGMAINLTNTGSSRVLTFTDLGNEQLSVRFNGNTLRWFVVRGNTTTLGTETTWAGNTTGLNQWRYLEAKVTFGSGTSGAYEVRLDGQDVPGLSGAGGGLVTGQNTISTANAYCNGYLLGSAPGAVNVGPLGPFTWLVDDFYILNTSGSVNNDFLGDVRVVGMLPSNNGTYSQLTRTGGTSSGNYTALTEATQDGDTSYVSTFTVGQQDTYDYPNLAANVTSIKAIQASYVARKDDAGTRSLEMHVVNAASEADSATTFALQPGYQRVNLIMETNPVTSAAWSVSDWNSTTQIGPKVAS